MSTIMPIFSVAVPVPLRQAFDFIAPADGHLPVVGSRVRVPFGRRILVGIIVENKPTSSYPQEKLKRILEVLDKEPIFDPDLWSSLHWLAGYYLAPIGEVFDMALPVKLRKGECLTPASKKTWALSETGRSSPIDQLHRAPLQLAIVKRFMQEPTLSAEDFKNQAGAWRQAITALLKKQWLIEFEEPPQLKCAARSDVANKPGFELNAEQQHAIGSLSELVDQAEFSCSLLHGVTGSGKTEVYFALMQQVVERGQQALLLVPEIGLTPQLITRVHATFSCPMTVMHSGLNESERHLAWWHARQGDAQIVIGTRSAVFSSFHDLGLIIVDEEHDGSFKQQDGVRYQARDVAIYRAKQQAIPIVLGSATPAMESYANVQSGRYHGFRLNQRATRAALPTIKLLDTNLLPCTDGLSPPMLEAISTTLAAGKQIMLFINRRGYAPVMYCTECGETSKCHRCDANLTFHRHANKMRCHHCGFEGSAVNHCANCHRATMVEVGEGTQRVEDALSLRFPDARLLRIDRDTTRRKGELASLLEQARKGDADILLGTQLLTKGHDFPEVTTVGILAADLGLHSTDFRASEVLFQQILQVAGRAGRRDLPGRVFIQTAFPTNPFFDWVREHDFDGFAEALLTERRSAEYPPFGYFALLRAESTHQARALQFLRRAKAGIHAQQGVRVMDAIPAPMERRAGKFRAQLLICSKRRSSLHATLQQWLNQLGDGADSRRLSASVRWNLDVDPFDLY
ncbi:MAG: primosomal protein N' [Gammaproteobacteria bacterium]|nr:primosomal protein N' [Gammaproteobacteria bacterium]